MKTIKQTIITNKIVGFEGSGFDNKIRIVDKSKRYWCDFCGNYEKVCRFNEQLHMDICKECLMKIVKVM